MIACLLVTKCHHKFVLPAKCQFLDTIKPTIKCSICVPWMDGAEDCCTYLMDVVEDYCTYLLALRTGQAENYCTYLMDVVEDCCIILHLRTRAEDYCTICLHTRNIFPFSPSNVCTYTPLIDRCHCGDRVLIS